MIVSCPSCQTRYRHPVPHVPDRGTARCSRCDEVFRVSRPARAYLLLRADGGAGGHVMPAAVRMPPMGGRAAPGLAIGMDDPTLAARLGATALDGHGGGAALTYRIEADTEGQPADGKAGAEGSSTTRPRADTGRWKHAALTVVLAGLGAVAGLGVARGFDIIPWGAMLVGAAAGLLVSRLGQTWRRAES